MPDDFVNSVWGKIKIKDSWVAWRRGWIAEGIVWLQISDPYLTRCVTVDKFLDINVYLGIFFFFCESLMNLYVKHLKQSEFCKNCHYHHLHHPKPWLQMSVMCRWLPNGRLQARQLLNPQALVSRCFPGMSTQADVIFLSLSNFNIPPVDVLVFWHVFWSSPVAVTTIRASVQTKYLVYHL